MATQEIYTDLTLKGNEIKDARVENVTALPEGSKGRLVYLTVTDGNNNSGFYYHDGAGWVCVGTTAAEAALDTRLQAVEAQVGGGSGEGSLAQTVATLKTDVDQNKKDIATNKSGVADNKKSIGDVKTTADNAAAAIVTINSIIGDDATADSVKGRIKALEDTSATDTGRISALETSVGKTASEGLRGDVATLKTTVGSASSGLVKDVADLQTEIAKKANSTDVYTIAQADEKIKVATDAAATNTTAIKALQDADYLPKTEAATTYRTIADSYTKDEVDNAVKVAVGSAYKVKGSKDSVTELPADATTGDVWNIKAAFSDGGKNYPAGTNVVFVGAGEGEAGEHLGGKWDVLAGVTDLTGYSTTTQMNSAIDTKIANAGHATTDALTEGLALKVDKTTTVNGHALSANVTVTKADVGLGDVENTADADKPISTATQTALDKKVDKLVTKPDEGTYTKVTINTEGQVTAGASITAAEIPDLTASKITDFNAKAIAAGRKQATVSMTVSEAFQDTGITGLSAYPSAVTVYNPDGQIVFVAIKYDSTTKKLMYQTNVALTATVVVSL